MQSLQIEFVTRPKLSVSMTGALLLTVGVTLLGIVLRLASTQHSRYQAASDLHRLAAARAEASATLLRSANPLDLTAIKQAGAVLDALSVPWDDLFVTIEATDVEGVALLTLSPDPRTDNLTISGEAKTLEDALSYLARLSEQPRLHDVSLVSYQMVQRDGQSALQFSLVAKWK